MGQALFKYVAGLSVNDNRDVAWQRIALIVSVLIVIGLVPSLLILGLVLQASGEANSYSATFSKHAYLVSTQIFYFFLSWAVFLFFGTHGERLIYQHYQGNGRQNRAEAYVGDPDGDRLD